MSSRSGVMSSSHYSEDSDQRSGDSTAASSNISSSTTKLTPTRSKANLIQSRCDYNFRVTVLGDSGSSKRELVHNLIYGKLSREAAKQDRFLDQISG